jgi:hypothetical protein
MQIEQRFLNCKDILAFAKENGNLEMPSTDHKNTVVCPSKLVEETSVETAGLPPDQQALFDDLLPFRDKGSLKRETRERMGHYVLKIDEIL